ERPHAERLRGVARGNRRLSRGERRPLARSLEADPPRARPRDDVALAIGDRHGRIVERRVDVREAVMDDALLAALLERLLLRRAPGAFFAAFGPWRCRRVDRFVFGHVLNRLLLCYRALA